MKKGLYSLTNISLRKKSDLDRVYRKGKKLNFKYYSVYYISSVDKRIAFSIPSWCGSAVYRNRRRRLIREYFRKNLAFLPEIHCVFSMIKKPESETIEKLEIERILKCLKSLRL